MDEKEKKKDMEIVNGDGTSLDISPVYDHIILDENTKKNDKDKKIVVPEKKKK